MTRYHKYLRLSSDDIRKTIKLLETMNDKMSQVQGRFIENSLDYLEERAKYHLAQSIGHSWYVPTGALMASFKKEYGQELGRLFNDYFTAAWVEFGTGIIGQGTHPDSGGYIYDVNNHGEDGWVYRDKNGNYHFTRGMEAHRYMFNALVDYLTEGAQKQFNDAFDKVLGGDMKSWIAK